MNWGDIIFTIAAYGVPIIVILLVIFLLRRKKVK